MTILRRRSDELDYLALADSPLLLDIDDEIRLITDDRMAHLPDYSYEAVIAAQNTPGGYYVASTLPAAAHQAVHGSVPASTVHAAALLSDGASRLADHFHQMSWTELFAMLRNDGPAAVIARTREVERTDRGTDDGRRRKHHDDTTAVFAENLRPDGAAQNPLSPAKKAPLG